VLLDTNKEWKACIKNDSQHVVQEELLNSETKSFLDKFDEDFRERLDDTNHVNYDTFPGTVCFDEEDSIEEQVNDAWYRQ
jgi:hypothetical protein